MRVGEAVAERVESRARAAIIRGYGFLRKRDYREAPYRNCYIRCPFAVGRQMRRPADRERARDETLARMGQLELQRKRYADVQLASATRELLLETLRLGVRSDRATVSNTLRRVATKIKMQKDRRTLYATVPCAVLSDHTPGATRTPAHSIEGRRSMH